MLWACSWQILIVGITGMEEISQLGQVTCVLCSVSEQKGLHFPNQPLLGTSLRSPRIIVSLAAQWPLVLTNYLQGSAF